MMMMNPHDNDVSSSFPSRSSTRITDGTTFNCYWAIKIIWKFRYPTYNHSRLFQFNVQEYCHFPFYHTIKCSKCFGKKIYLRFNGEKRQHGVSHSTQGIHYAALQKFKGL